MANKKLEFHKVTEKEKEQIQKDVKSLLIKFSDKLAKIKTRDEHFKSTENPIGLREEGTPWKTDQDLHDLTLLNAPFVEDNSIIAEKGAWTK